MLAGKSLVTLVLLASGTSATQQTRDLSLGSLLGNSAPDSSSAESDGNDTAASHFAFGGKNGHGNPDSTGTHGGIWRNKAKAKRDPSVSNLGDVRLASAEDVLGALLAHKDDAAPESTGTSLNKPKRSLSLPGLGDTRVASAEDVLGSLIAHKDDQQPPPQKQQQPQQAQKETGLGAGLGSLNGLDLDALNGLDLDSLAGLNLPGLSSNKGASDLSLGQVTGDTLPLPAGLAGDRNNNNDTDAAVPEENKKGSLSLGDLTGDALPKPADLAGDLTYQGPEGQEPRGPNDQPAYSPPDVLDPNKISADELTKALNGGGLTNLADVGMYDGSSDNHQGTTPNREEYTPPFVSKLSGLVGRRQLLADGLPSVMDLVGAGDADRYPGGPGGHQKQQLGHRSIETPLGALPAVTENGIARNPSLDESHAGASSAQQDYRPKILTDAGIIKKRQGLEYGVGSITGIAVVGGSSVYDSQPNAAEQRKIAKQEAMEPKTPLNNLKNLGVDPDSLGLKDVAGQVAPQELLAGLTGAVHRRQLLSGLLSGLGSSGPRPGDKDYAEKQTQRAISAGLLEADKATGSADELFSKEIPDTFSKELPGLLEPVTGSHWKPQGTSDKDESQLPVVGSLMHKRAEHEDDDAHAVTFADKIRAATFSSSRGRLEDDGKRITRRNPATARTATNFERLMGQLLLARQDQKDIQGKLDEQIQKLRSNNFSPQEAHAIGTLVKDSAHEWEDKCRSKSVAIHGLADEVEQKRDQPSYNKQRRQASALIKDMISTDQLILSSFEDVAKAQPESAHVVKPSVHNVASCVDRDIYEGAGKERIEKESLDTLGVAPQLGEYFDNLVDVSRALA